MLQTPRKQDSESSRELYARTRSWAYQGAADGLPRATDFIAVLRKKRGAVIFKMCTKAFL